MNQELLTLRTMESSVIKARRLLLSAILGWSTLIIIIGFSNRHDFCSLLPFRRKLLCFPSEWVNVTIECEPSMNTADFDPIFPVLWNFPGEEVFFRVFYRNDVDRTLWKVNWFSFLIETRRNMRMILIGQTPSVFKQLLSSNVFKR